jgi:Icc-related predicted phosphoesterase
MRVFALSDVHVDYDVNRQWVGDISRYDFQHDVLLLAGDVSDSLERLRWCVSTLARRFLKVLFVPGNHELWVIRDDPGWHSLRKFDEVQATVKDAGAAVDPCVFGDLSVVPLHAWYDFTFGPPGPDLSGWMDFHACRWPAGYTPSGVTSHFLNLNESALGARNTTLISFSHFLPRVDLMPAYIPQDRRFLYPVLGTHRLEEQIRRMQPRIHVYGHSHVNRMVDIDGIVYVNNAFAYPQEVRIAAKRLLCVHEC